MWGRTAAKSSAKPIVVPAADASILASGIPLPTCARLD
jgi:hypothetical protein